MVESQEQAATRAVTSSAGEQARLEALLDDSKPAYLPGSESLHWLLKTPFRYPPLQHGSRFGRMTDPGVLYSSLELETAMTESSVYLWLFRGGLADPGPLEVIRAGRTAIRVQLDSDHSVDLTRQASPQINAQLSDPASYEASQALGDTLRREAVALIVFESARRPGATNCAALSPGAVVADQDPAQVHWHLQLNRDTCWWGRGGNPGFEVRFTDVSVDGRIPHPAL